MCTREDALAYILGALFIDDVMSFNSLTTPNMFRFQMVQSCLVGEWFCFQMVGPFLDAIL